MQERKSIAHSPRQRNEELVVTRSRQPGQYSGTAFNSNQIIAFISDNSGHPLRPYFNDAAA
jgi:hypothetical protein